MSEIQSDVIDLLAGIEPGSPLHDIRNQRAQARDNAQKSYLALFEPEVPGDVTALERYVVAVFVVGLHRQPALVDFYAEGLRRNGRPETSEALAAETARGAVEGPYGHYPEGPLSIENLDGPKYQVTPENSNVFGSRLTAALEHAHLLVFHPRDANPKALQKLLDAGWSTTDIVTLSQLVSFLAFQIRVVAGLRSLAVHSDRIASAQQTPVFTEALASGHI
jgi:CMD domain protein